MSKPLDDILRAMGCPTADLATSEIPGPIKIGGMNFSNAATVGQLVARISLVRPLIPTASYFVGAVSGAGASAPTANPVNRIPTPPNASTPGHALFSYMAGNTHLGMWARGFPRAAIPCNVPIVFGARAYREANMSAGLVARVTLGKAAATPGDPSSRAIGWRKIGTGPLQLLVHNGTALTAETSTFTESVGSAFDWQITSDGFGNCALYINGEVVASTDKGPKTGNLGGTFYVEEIDATAGTHTATGAIWNERGSIIVGNI